LSPAGAVLVLLVACIGPDLPVSLNSIVSIGSEPSPQVRLVLLKKEGPMTNQNDEEKENMRVMWIASGVIVLIILGLMGMSMLSNTSTGPTEMSSQSRTAPAK
jgi:hypothetical protein